MPSTLTEQTFQTIEIVKEEEIAAPIGIVFETILEQIGPYNETPDGTKVPMKIEAWPGGRWFRDLGNNTGHFWAHVQSIKPPSLLEFHGPLFMSTPAISHVLYRLTEERGITLIKFSHRAIGILPAEIADGSRVNVGWASQFSRLRKFAELKAKESK